MKSLAPDGFAVVTAGGGAAGSVVLVVVAGGTYIDIKKDRNTHMRAYLQTYMRTVLPSRPSKNMTKRTNNQLSPDGFAVVTPFALLVVEVTAQTYIHT